MSSGFVAAGAGASESSGGGDGGGGGSGGGGDAAWAAARSAVQSARNPPAPSEPEDSRSLYDILQANKARKQEEFEEKLKFKNQFKPLDEDDVEYLDSLLSTEKRAEALRKRELQTQLDEFRRLQSEGDRPGALADVGGDGGEGGGDEFGTWKKRKRKEKEKGKGKGVKAGREVGLGLGLGVKVRRTSSGGKVPVVGEAEEEEMKKQAEKKEGEVLVVDKNQEKTAVEKAVGKKAEKGTEKADEKTEEKKPPPSKAPAMLVEYDSDDDD